MNRARETTDPKAHSPSDPERAWDEVSHTAPVSVVPIDPADAEAVPCLVALAGPLAGEVFRLEQAQMRIGRADDADIRIIESSVSRYHAVIYRTDSGSCRIRDLASTNGTFVNGEGIDDVDLNLGDRVQLGHKSVFKLEYHGPAEKELHDHLLQVGTRDPLTDTFNRRYLDQHLHADFHSALRHNEGLSVIIIDIDHFKSVNDKYGHLAGDSVLERLAHLVASRVRAEDILARYGGEEFVVVLRHSSERGARTLAESLRSLVERTPFIFKGQKIPVTVSVGLATLSQPRTYESSDALLAAADRALYAAKRGGRNRVELASSAATRTTQTRG